uniref:Uncharacterized protein n=1 Tax=Leersia perrieri TaxID=77586 RepID=A0A0D9WU28_9ORYZ
MNTANPWPHDQMEAAAVTGIGLKPMHVSMFDVLL